MLLADFDVSWRVNTVREIKTVFTAELEQGHLVVLHVPEEWYPRVTGAMHILLVYYSIHDHVDAVMLIQVSLWPSCRSKEELQ